MSFEQLQPGSSTALETPPELLPRTGYYPPPPESYPDSREVGIIEYLAVLQKRKWTLIATVVVAITLAALISLRMTRLYEAVGRIAIFRESPPPLGSKDVDVSSDDLDYSVALDTQVNIIHSDSLALETARRLGLDKKLRGGRPAGVSLSPREQEELIQRILAPLKVSVVPNTRLVELRYTDPDPKFAADVVNTVAQTYIEDNFKGKYDAAMQTTEWLSKQLADMEVKVETAQEKLVRYQRDNGIIGLDEKQNIITAKLDELNRELTGAEADRMQKEANYRAAEAGGDAPLNESSPVLDKLRNQLTDLKTQYADGSVRFGPAYPKMQELERQIAQVQAAIDQENRRNLERLRLAYQAALEREKLLQGALEAQKGDANRLNEKAIEYGLLKRDAETSRQLYEGLLERLKEAGISAGLKSNNLRVVDAARVPLYPSKPDVPRNLEFATLFGLVGGVALVFLMEALDTSIRTPDQIQALCGLPVLATIPIHLKLNAGRSRLLGPGSREAQAIELAVFSNPRSQVSEAYRALRTSLLLSLPGAPPKVLVVTSALPQEGKTTTAVNTALTLAQQGSRVLLVDADLRRPSVHRVMGVANGTGLSAVLTGAEASESVTLQSQQVASLYVLPAGNPPRQPAELLGSIGACIEQWRKQYDHIVIDTPPVLSVTDAVLVAACADTVVLVTRAGSTTKAALRRTADLLQRVNTAIAGVVLNGININSADYYYYYGSKHGSSYYTPEASQ